MLVKDIANQRRRYKSRGFYVQKMPQASPAIDPNDPKTIAKRITTLAHMRHYRLEAYVAMQPTESIEVSEDYAVGV